MFRFLHSMIVYRSRMVITLDLFRVYAPKSAVRCEKADGFSWLPEHEHCVSIDQQSSRISQ
jgi:hypothetical protein